MSKQKQENNVNPKHMVLASLLGAFPFENIVIMANSQRMSWKDFATMFPLDNLETLKAIVYSPHMCMIAENQGRYWKQRVVFAAEAMANGLANPEKLIDSLLNPKL